MGGTPATPSFLLRVALGGISSVGLNEDDKLGRVVGIVVDVFVVAIVEGFFVGVGRVVALVKDFMVVVV